jgi:hypothetical protein
MGWHGGCAIVHSGIDRRFSPCTGGEVNTVSEELELGAKQRTGLHAGPRVAAAMALTLALAACGGASDAAEGPEGVQEAESVGEVTTEAPRAAPAPAPVAAIPAGTRLVFEVTEDVSTATHEAGARFNLRLVDDVRGAHGAVIPAGSSARGVVTESRRSGSADEDALLAVRIASVEVNGGYEDIRGTVESTQIEASARDSGQRTAAKVATGAAAGAVIGQILGRDTRSTVTGAAVGAAAGMGIALTTRDGHAVLTRGSLVEVRLDQAVVVD